MQKDNNHLFDFVIVIDVERLATLLIKTVNGVLEIPIKVFCSYNKTQRGLTHGDLSHITNVT